MEELVLENPVPVSANVNIAPSGTYTNNSLGILAGGFFTVSQTSMLNGVGTTATLHPTFYALANTTSGSAILDTSGYTTPFIKYGNSLVGCYASGTNIPAGTTVLSVNLAGTQVTLSNNTTSTSSNVFISITGSPQQRFLVLDDAGHTLGVLAVTPGHETTTLFSSPITLNPGTTYAIITVVGHGQIGYSSSRDVSGLSTSTLQLGNGIYSVLSSGPGSFGVSTLGTFVSGSAAVNLDHIYSGIGVGDWLYPTFGVPAEPLVSNISSTSFTNVTMNVPATGTFTNVTTKFWNSNSAIQYVGSIASPFTNITSMSTGSTFWYADIFLNMNTILEEPLFIPPPASSTAGPLSFTISLPTALLPNDLQEWDLQYAKSSDNFSFGEWFDVGTFPAQASQDVMDESTTNTIGVYTHQVPDTISPLPFYIYRYRLRAHNAESEWSSVTFAGQIQNQSV